MLRFASFFTPPSRRIYFWLFWRFAFFRLGSLFRGRKRVCDRRRDGLGFAGRVWDDREPALLLRGVLAHGQQHQGVEALRRHRQ